MKMKLEDPICPGCGVFMQDKDPNFLGYYQPRKMKMEEFSDEVDDGFDDDGVEEDDDEMGFLNGSESTLGEESEGLTDELDWEEEYWVKMMMRSWNWMGLHLLELGMVT